MGKIQLLLKYKNNYICELNYGQIDFIQVPRYFYFQNEPCYQNVSVFITLLLSGNIQTNYESNHSYDYFTWRTLFEEYFIPECFYQIDEDTYLYDIDECHMVDLSCFDKSLENLSDRLVCKSVRDFRDIQKQLLVIKEGVVSEEVPFHYNVNCKVNLELLNAIFQLHKKRTEKDVLLLYSGGKDSTLSAIRLKKAGYHVHFTHFDNGNMLDIDKPYLTYKKIFFGDENFYFSYQLSSLDIKNLFQEFYFPWTSKNREDLNHGTLTSEIRCLSCRLAMYTKAFEVAVHGNFKILAEGARISQKFMIEQIPMITRLQNLANELDFELLFPVLELQDNQEEVQELLRSGYSSKTWESKCLIGREPKDKTQEDEKIILDYYESIIKPKVLEKVKREKRRKELFSCSDRNY